MKKIFWCIQHIDEIGGTEMVSTDLMNHLCNDYDITCIITSKQINKDAYKLDDKIHRFYLNVPHKVTRFDAYFEKYKKVHRYFSIIGLSLRSFYHFFLKKGIYRHRIKKLVKANKGTLIASSMDSYLFAPKGVETIYHFHFNSLLYFDKSNRFMLRLARKADKYVFLSKSTMDVVTSRDEYLKDKSYFVYNPVRFEPILDLNYYNNRIVFAGRFMNQKDPLLALEIIKELKTRHFSFHFDMFGEGPLKAKMEEYIENNQLNQFVSLHEPTKNIKDEFLKSDLLLLTSKYEGFGLVKVEANAMSTPVITSNWGDTVYEIYREGIDSFIIDSRDPKIYADKIIQILSNKEELAKLKESSYRSAFDFSYDKIINSWKEILL